MPLGDFTHLLTSVPTIQLRATVLAEEHWPFAPGSSRPLTVRVQGR